MYEMATGRRAFAGQTTAIIFDEILNRMPPSPVRLNPGMPSELEHIINKALEKDRELRYGTAAELRADLKRLKREMESGRASAARPSPEPEPVPRASSRLASSRMTLWLTAFIGIVVAAASAYKLILGRHD